MRTPAARLFPVAAAVAAAGLLLMPRPARWLGAWHGELLDLGHVPLFAALVLVLRFAAGFTVGRALLAAVAVAAVAEVVQPWVGRSGGWADFLTGVLGAVAAAAAVRAWEPRPTGARVGYAVVAAAAVAWPVVEAGPYLADTVDGRDAFPVLADFTTDRQFRRWVCDQATLTRQGAAARLELLPGPEDYPGAALRPVVPDFRGHRWLCCSFEVVGVPLELVFSVRSGVPGAAGTTHVQAEAEYAGGRHVVRLDLAALAARARPAPLDLSDVRYVQLFVLRPAEPRTVVVYRVWLEP
ncbi:MAG: hypothetical protein C0501_20090 [Isosphaera sp.]|nr:hypothetical protein [Isosphaera sp.]